MFGGTLRDVYACWFVGAIVPTSPAGGTRASKRGGKTWYYCAICKRAAAAASFRSSH